MKSHDTYNSLSEKEKYYFQQIEYYSDEIPGMSINTLAHKIYTSPASLSRLVKKLGYSNYKEFRNSFIKKRNIYSDSATQAHVNNIFDSYTEIVDNFILETLVQAHSIYIVAFGNSSGLGQELAVTLSKAKYIVYVINDSDFLLQVKSTIKEGDIVIYISYHGADVDMQKLAISLKHTNKQILLTSSLNTALSSHVSLIVNTHSEELGLPFTSRIALQALVTIIGLEVHKKR